MNVRLTVFNATLLLVANLPLAVAGVDPDESTAHTTRMPVLAAAISDDSTPARALPTGDITANTTKDGVRHIQFYASDKAAELRLEQTNVLSLPDSRLRVGALFNEVRDNALIGALLFDTQPADIDNLTVSFGASVYAGLLAIENNDVIGIGAMAEGSYRFPVAEFPLTLSAGLGYAPDILTFGQSDRIFDWNVRASLPLTEQITGFAGVRYLQFDTRPGERELDRRVHLGIRWAL